MKNLLLFTFLLLSNIAYAQVYTIDTVPNEKLTTGSYVSNPDHIISDSTVEKINQVLAGLEQASTAQVAVVVLKSIGTEDHIDFSQRLFQAWGIGQASNNNGLLILFVLDQREIRLHTGYGIEGILTDAICNRIEKNYMVPYFKEGNYDKGILQGVQRVASLLNNPELVSEENEHSSLHPTPGFYVFMLFMWCGVMLVPFMFKYFSEGFKGQGNQRRRTDIRMSRKQWALLHFVVFFILFALVIHFYEFRSPYPYLFLFEVCGIALLVYKYIRIVSAGDNLYAMKEYAAVYNLYQEYQTTFSVALFFFPIPMAFFFPYYLSRKRSYRNHPRTCAKCSHQKIKLSETSDDQYLQAGQIFEENLGSVDYDVWVCPNCKDVTIESYISRSTKYTVCPECNVKALHSISRKTIKYATTSHSGEGEEIKECKYCHHQVKSRYSIARKQRSSSSSSSSGGGGGGSWGGGSSGGGGSSSSW